MKAEFEITAQVLIFVKTTVTADSAEEAERIAKARTIVHKGSPLGYWVIPNIDAFEFEEIEISKLR